MSRYQIDFQTEVPVEGQIIEYIARAADISLAFEDVPPSAALTVLLTGDKHIRQLNQDFLGYDEPTDVLSFPAGEPMPGAGSYLGDIAISLPAAQRQATQAGHSLREELQLLVVHAILHLLGFDHGNPDEKAEMWAIQSAILEKLGAQIEGPD